MKKLFTLGLLVGAFVVTPVMADVEMTIYYSTTCPHCHHARDFTKNNLIYEYSTLSVKQINVTQEANRPLFQKVVKDCGYNSGGVPIITIDGKCFQGYGSDETTGQQFRDVIDSRLSDELRDAAAANRKAMVENPEKFKADNANRLDAMREQIGSDQKKNDGTPLIFWIILGVLTVSLGFVLLRKKKS